MSMFSWYFNLESAWVSLAFLLVAGIAIHRHPLLITLWSACDDPSGRSGGRRPAQIPQLGTSQASKESHNS